MKFAYRVLIFLHFTCSAFSKQHDFFSTLHKEYIAKATEHNPVCGQIINKAFNYFYRLPRQSKVVDLFENNSVQNLYLLPICRSSNNEFNQVVQGSQQLMLVFLYKKIFDEFIEQTEQFVEELSYSLDYWRMEKFYTSLPFLRKHPVYWFHSPLHKKHVQQHIQALTQVEQSITSLLGISLHGRFVLSKIQHDQDIPEVLQQSMQPLYQYFNLAVNNFASLELLFHDAVWLYEQSQNQLESCKKTLQEHKKPHHVVVHSFLYSCIACGLVAGYAAYKIHEDDVPEYQRKAHVAWDNFVLEYIQIPLHSLKEILWDNKIQEMPKLKKPAAFKPAKLKAPQEITLDEQDYEIKLGSYEIKKINDIRDQLNDVKRFVNEATLYGVDFVNESIENSAEFINENAAIGAEFINETGELTNKTILRNQQVNLHLAAIGPVIIVSYLMYRVGKGMYKQYVTHESWYKPMRLMVREIDKILNKNNLQQERSYFDDGLIYILVLRLKDFVYCLPNEEIYLLEQDLQELISYDLNYGQKRGVLKRMYRTYPFLKKSAYA